MSIRRWKQKEAQRLGLERPPAPPGQGRRRKRSLAEKMRPERVQERDPSRAIEDAMGRLNDGLTVDEALSWAHRAALSAKRR